NRTVPAALAHTAARDAFSVYHQTGRDDRERVVSAYKDAGIEARVEAFIEDMAEAYSWADLVICRAGALTVAELAVVGVAAILVPYPHATDDHQTGNARFLADAGAAILLPEADMDSAGLATLLSDFSAQRDVLLEMACRARALAMPEAARRVAELCLQVARPGGAA
ncbi:MAG: UDP-N-acetylglucosamine--N-acetylmuramyl-(pentapeptide) pyrophosphoryl-undecaprenol N-acetylglucosamine transferase, partial [Gammaproteobacteria bacterium]|nr:UDP-N-acetylglucosamine--N-acetylmuramyl-(pentapeptide) pyrophosphoryl-undecaprenol N-acetylglucosamine transferase [Gammaproteobacteria bacterium]